MPCPGVSVKVPAMRSPLFPRLLLIFALLFAQFGSLTHGISHALAEQGKSSDQSLPHDKHGGLCAAYAHIGSAVGSNSINFASSETCETFHLDNSSSFISNSFVAFAARAPPHSV